MNEQEITTLGASLRQIDRKMLTTHTSEEVEKVWYQGGEPYFDLFVELRGGNIDWCQLSLRGRLISWRSRCCQWKTGKTNELCIDDVELYPASKIIESDRKPDLVFLNLAKEILSTRAGEPIFDQVLALFD